MPTKREVSNCADVYCLYSSSSKIRGIGFGILLLRKVFMIKRNSCCGFDASHFLFSSTMESRKLRSKSLKVESKALFDFDNVNEYLYNDKEIAIGGNGAVYHIMGVVYPSCRNSSPTQR